MNGETQLVKINYVPAARFCAQVRGGQEGIFDRHLKDQEQSSKQLRDCQAAVGKLLKALEPPTLAFLAEALSKGKVNCWTREKDLVSTLNNYFDFSYLVVAELFKLTDYDDCEFWFAQISDKPCDCPFTHVTLAWILSSVQKKASKPDQCRYVNSVMLSVQRIRPESN